MNHCAAYLKPNKIVYLTYKNWYLKKKQDIVLKNSEILNDVNLFYNQNKKLKFE